MISYHFIQVFLKLVQVQTARSWPSAARFVMWKDQSVSRTCVNEKSSRYAFPTPASNSRTETLQSIKHSQASCSWTRINMFQIVPERLPQQGHITRRHDALSDLHERIVMLNQSFQST